MSIEKWQNGKKLDRHAPEIEDMFAIDYPLGEQDWELEEKRKRSKINQAR